MMNQRRLRKIAQMAGGALAAVVLIPQVAGAQGHTDRDHRDDRGERNRRCVHDVTYEEVLDCVTVEAVREHQATFQRIADENDGTRASGTPGYDASADYVEHTLRRAGYDVTRQEFDFPYFEERSPAELAQTAPTPTDYETGTFEFSGSGEVEGPVTPIDLAINADGTGGDSTSGCEAEDFAGADLSGPNDVVVVQRGTCAFGLKAQNAQDAGAEALVIFNQGNDPGREGLIAGTLGGDAAGVVTIPVVGASFADGKALADADEARVMADTFAETRTTSNVIAESRRGNDDNVVMVGAHLDSVPDGPGINDNGSGTAAILETALQLRKVHPENTLRFAFWGAEESGLLGSWHYVDGLTEAEREDIALYLNFDMVGSPNHIFMTYDADRSTFPAETTPIPDGSVAIEDTFERFYTKAEQPYDDAEYSGRSDYQAFIYNDIPAGGLFTGAEGVKTEEQAAIWGGTAGEWYDPCYHQACDTFDNVNMHALDVNSDAIAYAVLTYAFSTEDVNGVPGRSVPWDDDDDDDGDDDGDGDGGPEAVDGPRRTTGGAVTSGHVPHQTS